MTRLIVCSLALALCGCAAAPSRAGAPKEFATAVQAITGPNAEACGTIRMDKDSERIAGYQCLRDALDQHRAFWLASMNGMNMAWAANTDGKVWQLFLLGGKVTGGPCKQFEVTPEKGLHCSL